MFLIVASEGAQTEDSSFHTEKNETYEAYSNITLNYDNHESFESSILDIKTRTTMTFKTNENDQYHQVRWLYNLIPLIEKGKYLFISDMYNK